MTPGVDPPPSGTGDARRSARRALIVATAARSLVRDACCRFRLEDIADTVGVGKGTISLDFGSKELLVSEALRHITHELMRTINPAGAGEGSFELVGTLRRLARLAATRPEVLALLSPEALCDPRLRVTGVAPSATLRSHLEDVLEGARRTGELGANVDARLHAHLCIAALASASWAGTAGTDAETGVFRALTAAIPLRFDR